MAQSTPTQTKTPRYCIVAFLSKLPSKTLDEFRDYYEHNHIPLVLRTLRKAGASLPLVYTRRYLDAATPFVSASGKTAHFDCISELQFTNKDDFEKNWVAVLMHGEGSAAVGEDEERFLDRGTTLAYRFEVFQTDVGTE